MAEASNLKMASEFARFLTATKYLNWTAPELHAQAEDLVCDISEDDMIAKARVLFNFVRDQIDYQIPTRFLTGDTIIANWLLQFGRGNCLQKSLILSSLGRAVGIPTRLHFVDIVNHIAPPNYAKLYGKELPWHCYTEMWLNERWVVANPDYPQELCEKKGYPVVEFDGIHDAWLPATDLEGNQFIEYQKDHGWFADLPKWKMQWNYARAYLRPFIKAKLTKKKK